MRRIIIHKSDILDIYQMLAVKFSLHSSVDWMITQIRQEIVWSAQANCAALELQYA